MIVMVPLRAVLGVAALYVACATSEVRAEDASPWQRDAHSAVRLLAGSRSGTVLLGGVAIQLQPGWKTYWRTPGDSGVPPRFDFSKSDNVEAVTVLWPAPKKFDDGAGGTVPLRDPASSRTAECASRCHGEASSARTSPPANTTDKMAVAPSAARRGTMTIMRRLYRQASTQTIELRVIRGCLAPHA
jgi:hypothetical protein